MQRSTTLCFESLYQIRNGPLTGVLVKPKGKHYPSASLWEGCQVTGTSTYWSCEIYFSPERVNTLLLPLLICAYRKLGSKEIDK